MWSKIWARIGPYVTLKIFVTFLQEELSMILSFIAKVCGDMFTNWNGDVDPARLFPYLFTALCGIVFLWLSWLDTIWHHNFNSMAFSAGAVAIATQFVAAAAGVRIKQSSEIPMPPGGPSAGNGEGLGAHKPKSLVRRVVAGAVNGALNK
jgi:hypothetical protein